MIAMDTVKEAHEKKHIDHRISTDLMEELQSLHSEEAFHLALSQLFFSLPDGHYELTLERNIA